MVTQETFLNRIEAFLTSHNMTPAALGIAAVKDPNFVLDLRNGRSPQLKTVERVERYMVEHETKTETERQPQSGEAAA